MKQPSGAAGQILFALDALDRRKPWNKRRRFRVADRQELPAYAPEDVNSRASVAGLLRDHTSRKSAAHFVKPERLTGAFRTAGAARRSIDHFLG
jgi:hypothetical protein